VIARDARANRPIGRFAAGFFPGEAVADEVLLVGFDVEAEFFFDIVVAVWRDGLPELAESVEEVHTSPSFIAERFGGWHRGCAACRQKTRCECAEGEECGGGEQTVRGESAVHPGREKLS
jgi:hypothetical protein